MSNEMRSIEPKVPSGWIPIETCLAWIKPRLMVSGDQRYVLDNWDCKYVEIRVDMRTGLATMRPGNL
jgi:hypothetical protein